MTTQFTFRLYDTAAEGLFVDWVFVHFCWDPSGTGYYFKVDDSFRFFINSGAYHDFTGNIMVSQTWSGTCPFQVYVDGSAGSEADETRVWNTWTLNVLIPQALQVSIAANPNTGSAPLTVQFTSTVTGGVSPYDYSWTFGDSGVANLANPSHIYTTANTYTANLIVTDSRSIQESKSTMVTVTAPAALTATASASPTSGTAPLVVQFSASASGGTAPYRFSWVFGDTSTSNVQNPSHEYQNAGTYAAEVTVTDDASQTVKRPVSISVSSGTASLTATASASPTSGQAPLTVRFTGSASGGTTPYAFSWNFGDGGTSNLQNPSHEYQNAGTYTVTLTVTGGGQTTRTLSITVSAPVGPAGGDGLPNWLWIVIALIAAAAVAGVAFMMRRSRPRVAPPEPPRAPLQAPPTPPSAAGPPPAQMPTGMRACPNCGRMLPAVAEFCGFCGQRIQ